MSENERPPVLDFTEAVGLDAVLDRLDSIQPMRESVRRDLETNEREYRELLVRLRRLDNEDERLRQKVALLAGLDIEDRA